LAKSLYEQTGFWHELIDLPDEEIGEYLWKKMEDVPFDKILGK
jgi:hypothetical protein